MKISNWAFTPRAMTRCEFGMAYWSTQNKVRVAFLAFTNYKTQRLEIVLTSEEVDMFIDKLQRLKVLKEVEEGNYGSNPIRPDPTEPFDDEPRKLR